ncbi:MAG: hypothetical protein AMXMBFR61_24620 [Fimbriimonadales bacterium]
MEKWLLALAIVLIGGRHAVRSFEVAAAEDIRSKLPQPEGVLDLKVKPRHLLSFADGSMAEAAFFAEGIHTEGLPLFTEPTFSRAGHIETLRIRLRDSCITGLRVRDMWGEVPDCRYDWKYALSKKRIRLTESGVGRGRVEVSASALAEYLLAKNPMLESLTIRLRDGRFEAEGMARFLALMNFRVEGELEVEDGRRLNVVRASVTISGRQMEPAAAQAFVARLNPVVDETADLKLYGALIIRKLTLADDVLIAEGDMRIPVRPSP